jgi:ankyrin repeat protein
LLQARDNRAPIQVFQDLFNNALSVSLEALHDLTLTFFERANVVRLLLKHEPKIARNEDRRYGLLLRQASSEASFDTIQLILDSYREAISKKNGYGFLPLRMACRSGRSAQTSLELLLSRYPGAAGIAHEDENGHQFPLHDCLQRVRIHRSVDFVLSLIEAYPEAASFKKNGWTALHFACFRRFSLAIVHRLYRLYPEAVMVQDYLNRLPLHQACQSAHASLEVIKFLIEKASR